MVALDGKAIAGTYHNEGRKGLVYMISAWCSENKISLAQVKTHDKSNEITAIPELLDLLDLKGTVVTMDAMGCQKDIVKKIIKEKKADYLIGLKGNQGIMHRECLEYAQAIISQPQEKDQYETYRTFEKGHGRIEERKYYLFRDLEWFADKKEWAGLAGLLLTESRRTDVKSGKKGETEIRLYITSMKGDIKDVAQASRTHWGIENNLHWVLDVGFREDQWQTRLNVEATNLSQLRRLSANLLKLETDSKVSIQRKRYLCSLDLFYMEKVFSNPRLFSLTCPVSTSNITKGTNNIVSVSSKKLLNCLEHNKEFSSRGYERKSSASSGAAFITPAASLIFYCITYTSAHFN